MPGSLLPGTKVSWLSCKKKVRTGILRTLMQTTEHALVTCDHDGSTVKVPLYKIEDQQ